MSPGPCPAGLPAGIGARSEGALGAARNRGMASRIVEYSAIGKR